MTQPEADRSAIVDKLKEQAEGLKQYANTLTSDDQSGI